MLFRLIFAFAALVLSARAADPARAAQFEEAVRAYEKNDALTPPPRGGILFTGSSMLHGWSSLEENFRGLPVFVRAFDGWRMADAVTYAERINVAYRPRIIVLQAGGSDLAEGRTPEEVLGLFQRYVVKVQTLLPSVRIIFLGSSPHPFRPRGREQQQRLNNLIAAYIAGKQNLDFVDLWTAMLGPDGNVRPGLYVTDSYLPSADGYALRAKLIRPHLQ